jgi:hypothetical protein
MNIAKVLKLARGVTTLDEALEVLSVMGIEAEVTPIPFERAPAVAEVEALVTALRSGARGFYAIEANIKGLPLRAFVVVGKGPNAERLLPQKTLSDVTCVTAGL